MKLITLEDEYPVFNPEARMIKEFRDIIERDKGSKGDTQARKKTIATKELAFVHFYSHYNSEFVTSYEESERIPKIKKHLDLPTEWQPDGVIQMACLTYHDLIKTPSMNSLIEAREALFSADKLLRIYRRRLEEQLQKLDMELTGDSEEENEKKSEALLEKTTKAYDKIMDISNKMPNALDTINKLEERVKKEMQQEQKGKKNIDVNIHEL